MRNRAFILLVLASLTGTLVLIHANRNQRRCAAIVGDANAPFLGLGNPNGMCTEVLTDPLWARVMGGMSVLCLLAGGIFLERGYRDRLQEQRLLSRAGIRVSEESLPLEP